MFTTTPLDAVHNSDQSEDSQDEDYVQDLPTGVTSHYNRTATKTGNLYCTRKQILLFPHVFLDEINGSDTQYWFICRYFCTISLTGMKHLPDFRAELMIVAMRAEMTMMVSNLGNGQQTLENNIFKLNLKSFPLTLVMLKAKPALAATEAKSQIITNAWHWCLKKAGYKVFTAPLRLNEP